MAALPVNNPKRIVETLDSYLEQPTRIVLFGRAALALGFGGVGAKFGATKDVDAILPTVEMAKIESDDQFWNAVGLANESLAPAGLYLTHLFTDRQIALTADWLEKIVAIPSENYRFLLLFRPSATDLILTKMMRNDEHDLEDIRFILSRENIAPASLDQAFLDARPLEIPELQSIFVKMQPIVRQLALAAEKTRSAQHGAGLTGSSLDPDWWEKMTESPPIDRTIERDRGIEL